MCHFADEVKSTELFHVSQPVHWQCAVKPEPSTDLFDLSRNLTERVFARSNSSGVRQGAHEAPGYGILSSLITAGCHAAIKITEKI